MIPVSEQTFPPLNLERAKQLAAEVVAEFGPDYVYENPYRGTDLERSTCQYVHDGEPGCLVAHILQRHGVKLDALEAHEGDDAQGVLHKVLGIHRESTISGYLNRLQRQQDEGHTWGAALASAERAED